MTVSSTTLISLLLSLTLSAVTLYLKLCLPPDNARCRLPSSPPHRHLPSPPATARPGAAHRRAAATPEGARRHTALARHRVPPRARVRTPHSALPGSLWTATCSAVVLAEAETTTDSLVILYMFLLDLGSLQRRDGIAGGTRGCPWRRYSGESVVPMVPCVNLVRHACVGDGLW